MPMKQQVYIVEASGSGFVKVGAAFNVASRMDSLQIGNHVPLVVLHVEPGGKKRERELHEAFADHHHRGEWFRLEGKVVEYLESPTMPYAADTGREFCADHDPHTLVAAYMSEDAPGFGEAVRRVYQAQRTRKPLISPTANMDIF